MRRISHTDRGTMPYDPEEVSTWLHYRSSAPLKEKRYSEAADRAMEALIFAGKLFGLDRPNVAISLVNMGGVYYSWRIYAEPELPKRQALSVDETFHGLNHANVWLPLAFLAGACKKLEKKTKAKTSAEHVRKLYLRQFALNLRSCPILSPVSTRIHQPNFSFSTAAFK